MNKTMIIKALITIMGIIFLWVTTLSVCAQQTVSASDWETKVDERIDQYRKENVVIRIVQNGQPVNDVSVELKMLSHEFLFGCTVYSTGDYPPDTHFPELFNYATLVCYWPTDEWNKDRPNYPRFERLAEWCATNGITAKGHSLLYAENQPRWMAGMTPDEVYSRAMERVRAWTEHFRGKIDKWVLMNEMLRFYYPEERAKYSELIGMFDRNRVSLTMEALASARLGNPEATFLINDYTTNQSFVNFLNQLADETGKPVFDVIGIQCHMHSGTWNNDTIYNICERFAKLGKPLHFTEMTVLSALGPTTWDAAQPSPTTPEGEQWQMDEVKRIYTMMFSHPAVEAITWWDFSDDKSWNNHPSGLLRADCTPKPAYNALKELVRKKWSTNVTLKTDENGEVRLRAFRGSYECAVKLPSGVKSGKISVTKNAGALTVDVLSPEVWETASNTFNNAGN